MTSAATRALVWVRNIEGPSQLTAPAVLSAMHCKAEGDQCVVEMPVGEMKRKFGHQDNSTLRRILCHMEKLGLLRRTRTPGNRSGVVRFALCVETPIEEINERMASDPRYSGSQPQADRSEVEPQADRNATSGRSEPQADQNEVTPRGSERGSVTSGGSERGRVALARAELTSSELTNSESGDSELTTTLTTTRYLVDTTNGIAKAIPAQSKDGRVTTPMAVGAVTLAIQSRGWGHYRTTPRDNAAIKHTPGLILAAANDIADCWQDLLKKRWGSDYDQSHVAVHRIITELLPSYQAWVADGRPPPRTNGHSNYRAAKAVGFDTYGGEVTDYSKYIKPIGEDDDE